jgi:death-on-curing protein
MSQIIWLSKDECLALHDAMIALFGGCPGIRDVGRLEAALARALQMHDYSQASLPELAAALAEGIIQGHPFLDGNKRTGFMMAAGLLERNGLVFDASETEVVIKTLALASSQITTADYAGWLHRHSHPH